LIPLFQSGRDRIVLVIAVAAAAVMTATVAAAQNLDAGKPAAKLFAEGCATCHRSPRGLAKGRFSLTLTWFLKDHYATSADSAKSLAAYLQSVDEPSPRTAVRPKKPARSAPRPAKPVQTQ
jgi:mono/diheme cytochrome c family protein